MTSRLFPDARLRSLSDLVSWTGTASPSASTERATTDLLVDRRHLSVVVADEAQYRALVSVAEQIAHLRSAELQRFS